MIFLEVDPNIVKPGWTPLIITILLAAAIALLMMSMRRQMRKVRVPYREQIDDAPSERAEDRAQVDPQPGEDTDPDAATEATAGKSTHRASTE